MRGPVTSSLVLVIAVGMGAVRAQTEQGPTAELERRFDASLDAREMEFVSMLRAEGRRAASEFLDAHLDDLGKRSTANLDVLLAEC